MNVGVYFKTESTTGTIAAGKRADLLLLDANPLQNIDNSIEDRRRDGERPLDVEGRDRQEAGGGVLRGLGSRLGSGKILTKRSMAS